MVATKFTDTTGRSRLAASHRLLKGYLVNSDGHTVREMSSGKSDRVSYVERREGGIEREGEGAMEGGERERERERERELHTPHSCQQLYNVMYDRLQIYICTIKTFLCHSKTLLPNPSTVSMIFPL